ncbi:hypothetical protein BD309DRAFT_81884 [Dichomitus squalens]|nr:hypothetical protein BD309DRAFT_81884 [Dichomitus squalens]
MILHFIFIFVFIIARAHMRTRHPRNGLFALLVCHMQDMFMVRLAVPCCFLNTIASTHCYSPTMLAPRAMHAYAELRMSNAPSLTASNHACMHQWSTPHTWPSHSQSRRSFLPALPSDRVEEDWTKREKTSSARQGIISSSTSPAQTAGGSPRDLPSRLSAQLVESDTHVHCFRDRTQRLGYASRAPRRGKGGLVFTLW